jgi:hypothetical protein
VGGDGRRGPLGGRTAGRGVARVGVQLRRIGIEAEADLAAALIDERREPIRERSVRQP